MRALCVAILLCAGCPKKQTAPEPANPTDSAKGSAAEPPPPPSSGVAKPGDPCSGGEKPK
jgi:hypothetical protein